MTVTTIVIVSLSPEFGGAIVTISILVGAVKGLNLIKDMYLS